MFIDVRMSGFFFLFEEPCGLAPSCCLPVVLGLFLGDPWWKRLIQISRQGVDVGFIHAAEFREAGVGGFAVAQLQSVLCQDVSNVAQFFGAKPVLRQRLWRGA